MECRVEKIFVVALVAREFSQPSWFLRIRVREANCGLKLPFMEIRAALRGEVLIQALPLPEEKMKVFKLVLHMTVASMVGALEHWITFNLALKA